MHAAGLTAATHSEPEEGLHLGQIDAVLADSAQTGIVLASSAESGDPVSEAQAAREPAGSLPASEHAVALEEVAAPTGVAECTASTAYHTNDAGMDCRGQGHQQTSPQSLPAKCVRMHRVVHVLPAVNFDCAGSSPSG